MTTLAESGRLQPVRSRLLPALLAAVVLSLAFGTALAERASAGQPGLAESISAASAGLLTQLGSALPSGYAFGAGMVAAVNPCGFALLPGYLGLYLGSENGGLGLSSRLPRAVAISLTVSASFVLLFAAAGVLVAASASGAARFFPIAGLVVGVLLVTAGAALLGGARLDLALASRVEQGFSQAAQRHDVIGYAAYGFAYAAGSLGCTLPIFLTVVATGFAAGGPIGAISQFVLFGLGMGAVLTALTLATAILGHSAFRSIRKAGAYLQRLGAMALLLAGGYVVYYWLALGGVLSWI